VETTYFVGIIAKKTKDAKPICAHSYLI